MAETVSNAIAAVKANREFFCKFVSPNDAGATGGHQAGIYIPKNSHQFIFDSPGKKGQNKERVVELVWQDSTIANSCFKYYGVGTRNEYRITRLGRPLEEGQLIILVKKTINNFLGFILADPVEIEVFLQEFDLDEEKLNRYIRIDSRDSIKYDESVTFEEQPTDNTEVQSQNFEVIKSSFKPKAHILVLLGEELIKDPVMAIYELVKNAYDADAKSVDVYFNDITDIEKANIVIRDTGIGITDKILENVWLEPGTAYRKPYNDVGERQIIRTPIYSRTPMGEKGVGRFAVHKLGHKITLISRPCELTFDETGNVSKKLADYEINLHIDWNNFTQSKYLTEIDISYHKNLDPTSFLFNDSGTYIKVSDLKQTWTRGMARQLKRHTLSMVSPKNDRSKFQIDLIFNNNWLDRFPSVEDLLSQAPYKLHAIVDDSYNLTFEYSFQLANNKTIGTREIRQDSNYDRNISAAIRPLFRAHLEAKELDGKEIEEKLDEIVSKQIPFGGLLLELYSYDLDPITLRATTYTPDILKRTLKENYGIKVFKDDLRVYDYGEPGNDWLGLDIKRVNNKEWFSNNQNIGFIYLDSSSSGSLIEKTNREGFINNESFEYLKIVVDYLLIQFRIERQKDRSQWLRFSRRETDVKFHSRVSNFVSLVKETDIDDNEQKQKLIDEAEKIETEYQKAQDTLLVPAGVGMTASVALHEIEKLVPRMEETVAVAPVDQRKIQNQVEELDDYVSGILSVLKNAGIRRIDVREAIEQAVANYELKISRRRISITIEIGNDVTFVNCDKRYLLTMLMNLIDNSIYWLDTVNRDHKYILIKATKTNDVVSIIVADNGPGLKDSVHELITPFFTRKEGGIGLGLYLVDTLMIKFGKLKIYTNSQHPLIKPDETGAVVELVFNKDENDK